MNRDPKKQTAPPPKFDPNTYQKFVHPREIFPFSRIEQDFAVTQNSLRYQLARTLDRKGTTEYYNLYNRYGKIEHCKVHVSPKGLVQTLFWCVGGKKDYSFPETMPKYFVAANIDARGYIRGNPQKLPVHESMEEWYEQV